MADESKAQTLAALARSLGITVPEDSLSGLVAHFDNFTKLHDQVADADTTALPLDPTGIYRPW